MQIRVATWNVHGGQVASTAQVSFEQSLAMLRQAEPDLVALQEIEVDENSLRPAGATVEIGHAIGAPHFLTYGVSPSHHTPGRLLAVGLASRWPCTLVRRVPLPNPHLTMVDGSASPMRTHDKGVLTASVRTPRGPLLVCVVHSYPFHRFGASADEERFGPIWDALASDIDNLGDEPIVVAGDFNTEDRALLLRRVKTRTLHPAALEASLASRPNGQCHDDILYGAPLELENISSFQTFSDHHCLVGRLNDGNGDGSARADEEG